MAHLSKLKKGKKYFNLNSVLGYLKEENMMKEFTKVSSLDLYEDEEGDELFVERNDVAELLTLPEYLEIRTKITTLTF